MAEGDIVDVAFVDVQRFQVDQRLEQQHPLVGDLTAFSDVQVSESRQLGSATWAG